MQILQQDARILTDTQKQFHYIVSAPTDYGRQHGFTSTVRVRCCCGTVQEFDVTSADTARELALDAVNACSCGNGVR
jgi:hypothetical protein